MAVAVRQKIEVDAGAAFLGVERSARGFRWRERLDLPGRNLAVAISQRHGLPELLGRVLAGRGCTIDDVPVVLEPTLRALMPDPSVLRDMDTAASRLADAIQARAPVAVFGDYDVDGACSSALMQRFLDAHDVPCRIYIPDRIFEGYGPNPAAIELLAKEGARLLVTVDCGTTSFDSLAVAREMGLDTIVIDHHQADQRLPDVQAVVNPNRQDDISGLGYLCAAGVTFMSLVATARELRRRGTYANGKREPNLMSLLDLVALATVCDVVPLERLNRAFVARGLDVMKSRANAGLRALATAAGLNQAPTPYALGFVLGPRINAGGRIGDAGLGARLLSLDDEGAAEPIAQLLDRLNRERKAIEAEMLANAAAQAEAMLEADPDLPLLIMGSPEWHKGVVGLVASRLTERHRRPTCIISWEADAKTAGSGPTGTGSLRSVSGVDIGRAVRSAVDHGLLVKGGGHGMAAGLTVEHDRFEELKSFLFDQLRTAAGAARDAAALDLDGALTPAAVNDDTMDLLDKAGPYGQGNPQPRFVFPAHRVKFAKIVGENHVRCVLEASDGSRVDAVAFRASGQPVGEALLAAGGLPMHVAGCLKRDTWGGRQKIELLIDDVADPRTCGR